MKLFFTTLSFIMITGGLLQAATVQDLEVGYVFEPNTVVANEIPLTLAVPGWEANLATFEDFTGDVHCILGYDGFMGGSGFADIMWRDSDDDFLSEPNTPILAPYAICGSRASGDIGFIVYKFTLPDGYVTDSGGVIDANSIFRGDRTASNDKTWIGVGATFADNAASFIEPANLGSYSKEFMTGGTPPEWGTFTQQMSLSIPAGFAEFYVIIAKDWGGWNRFGFQHLSVNAVMEEGTPVIPDVPEFSQFVPGYYPNAVSPKELVLDEFNTTWNADLSTAPAFAGDVHAIMGYNGTHDYADMIYRKLDNGWFGVTQEPYISCDIAADGGKVGSFVYKFVISDGLVTGAGGTIDLGCFVRGTPDLLNWVGVSPTYIPGSATFTEMGNMASFTKEYMVGGVWGVYEQQLVLSIPAGLSEFYVAVVSDWGTSNYFGMYSMSVDAVVKDPILPAISWTVPDNRLLKYELDRTANNDIGFSGTVLDSWNIADDPNGVADAGMSRPAGMNLLKDSYLDITTAGAAVSPPMTHFAVRLNMGYVTTLWPANTWLRGAGASDPWNLAMDSIQAVAEGCVYAGIRHIILDGERYVNWPGGLPLTGTYLINQSDSTAIDEAYQRGLEIAAVLSSAALSLDVILLPELGSGYMGNTSSYPAWNSFRNGLLDGSATLKVYVGIEGTYADHSGTGVNDDVIELYGVGSFSDPIAYKAALTTYLQTIDANLRARTTTPANWDSRGGIVPGFWVLGTASDRPGKRSAWYTPEMFAAQLETYVALDVPLIFEYHPMYAWKQWFGNEVSSAGMYPYDGNPNADNLNNWAAEVSTHPYLEAYKAVLRERGTPSPIYGFPQPGDVNGDSYVDIDDVDDLALEWLDSSPTN
jgi:hypothetical protein